MAHKQPGQASMLWIMIKEYIKFVTTIAVIGGLYYIIIPLIGLIIENLLSH